MTDEYPWRNVEDDERPKKDTEDLSIGKAIEKSSGHINQEVKKANDPATPYALNLDAMYYIVLCGFSSHFRLNPTETEVLCFVASFHRKGLTCYATKDSIARVARTTPVTVFKVLKKLKERGLLEQSSSNGRTSLILGPEAIDRWKYHEGLIEASRNVRKNLRKPKNIW